VRSHFPPSGIRSPRSCPRHSRFRSGLGGTRTRSACAPGNALCKNPITGIADCCARAASGHAAAVPPSGVMNSRRFMLNMGTSSPVAWRRRHRAWRSVYRTLSLPQSSRQVLGADLNCSESRRAGRAFRRCEHQHSRSRLGCTPSSPQYCGSGMGPCPVEPHFCKARQPLPPLSLPAFEHEV